VLAVMRPSCQILMIPFGWRNTRLFYLYLLMHVQSSGTSVSQSRRRAHADLTQPRHRLVHCELVLTTAQVKALLRLGQLWRGHTSCRGL
jgi:hypothetical protein